MKLNNAAGRLTCHCVRLQTLYICLAASAQSCRNTYACLSVQKWCLTGMLSHQGSTFFGGGPSRCQLTINMCHSLLRHGSYDDWHAQFAAYMSTQQSLLALLYRYMYRLHNNRLCLQRRQPNVCTQADKSVNEVTQCNTMQCMDVADDFCTKMQTVHTSQGFCMQFTTKYMYTSRNHPLKDAGMYWHHLTATPGQSETGCFKHGAGISVCDQQKKYLKGCKRCHSEKHPP